MECKGCNIDKKIVNKWFMLCIECNNERLHGSKFGKQHNKSISKRGVFKTSKNKKKQKSISFNISKQNIDCEKSTYQKDNEFYKKCFDTFLHLCEECGKTQPQYFYDENGKVANRYRYSHIVPKSIAPELRHELENINDLCVECHNKWEGADKVDMKIYEKNKKRPLLKKYFIKLC